MFLSQSQSKRFYQLLYKLCEYTERTRHITGVPQSMRAASSQEDQREILEAIAEDPSVIDEMLAQEAHGLSQSDIDTYELWKHMYGGPCILKDHTETGNALFITPLGAIEVQGITQNISELIPETPAVAKTVFLPFDEIITYSGNISQWPVIFAPELLERVEEWEDTSQTVLRDAASFIARRDQYMIEELERDLEELEHEVEREYARYKGTLEPSAGFHEGKLADLDDEERGHRLRERLRAEESEYGAYVETMLNDTSIKANTECQLECCLGYYQKTLLIDIATDLGISSAPSKNKAWLSSEIAIRLLDAWRLKRLLSDLTPFELKSIKELLDRGGVASITLDDIDPLYDPGICIPYTFVIKKTNGEYIHFIPKDLQAALKKLDFDAITDTVCMKDRLVTRIELASELYGIAKMDDFVSAVRGDLDFAPDLIRDLIVSMSEDEDGCLSVVNHNDDLYVLHCELDPDYITDEVDDVSQEEIDIVIENILAYWEIIFEAQHEYGLRPLFDSNSLYTYVANLPSAKALRAWLDAHVPDGEDDFSYADCVIEELFETTRVPSSPHATVMVLKDFNALSEDMDEAEELLSHAMRFVNDIPRWSNAGWSPSEIIEKQTGQKVFYSENGKPMKIGRNDPCPCGSGKKYKKCCGR